MLKQRIITGACFTSIIVLVLIFSKYQVVMNIFCGLLAILSVYEILNITGWHKFWLIGIMAIIIGFTYPLHFKAFVYIALGTLIVSIIVYAIMMKKIQTMYLYESPLVFFLCFALIVAYKTLLELRLLEHGLFFCIYVILISFLSDIFAYFVGRKFGKHKLAPIVSPKKTIEGAVGGIVVTTIILVIVFAIYAKKNYLEFSYFKVIICTVISIIMGQFGDLSMSTIKRIVGVKDYSNILPGHGGILDRFDSLTFIAPFFFIFVMLLGL